MQNDSDPSLLHNLYKMNKRKYSDVYVCVCVCAKTFGYVDSSLIYQKKHDHTVISFTCEAASHVFVTEKINQSVNLVKAF